MARVFRWLFGLACVSASACVSYSVFAQQSPPNAVPEDAPEDAPPPSQPGREDPDQAPPSDSAEAPPSDSAETQSPDPGEASLSDSDQSPHAAPAPSADPAPAPPAPTAPDPSTPTFNANRAPTTDVTIDKPSGIGEQEAEAEREKLPWRNTVLSWSHTLTTQTVSIGADYQSSNPYYDWTFLVIPRYYIYESPRLESSIRADIGLVKEWTNSDTTTYEGEWDTIAGTSTDWTLYGVHSLKLREAGAYKTALDVYLPELIPPTSKASRNNGSILQLGIGAFPRQSLPLLGEGSDWLRSLTVVGRARYRYLFTGDTVPTRSDLDRVRMDVGGVSVPTDQLSGAAFAVHQARFGLDTIVNLAKGLTLANRFEWRPFWKYPVAEEVEIGNVLTGPVTVRAAEDATNFGVVSVFLLDLEVQPFDQASMSFTYANISQQIGSDGQRRNMLWSPSAVFALSLNLFLDAIYTGSSTQKPGAAWTSSG